MNGDFLTSFVPIFTAILQIFFIALIAGFLVRRKIVSQETINGLSRITILVFLPCLIFSKILKNFDPGQMEFWWAIPMTGIVMILLGIGLSALLFIRELPEKKNLLALSSIQNSAYLVLPLAEAVYPDQFETITVYIFLIVLGVSPSLWSFGRMLSDNDIEDKQKFTFKNILNPPFLANVIALSIVLVNLDESFPVFIVDSASFLGNATVPVVTFILGATLGSISFREWPSWLDTIRVLFVKFLFLPLVMLFVLINFDLVQQRPVLSEFLMIEASAAPATGLILQARTFGGDLQEVGSIMLLSYFACLLAIPGWISLLRFLA